MSQERLEAEGITSEQINLILKEAFQSDFILKNKDELDTDFKRKKVYKSKFDYVQPIEVIIDKQKETSFAYVHIIQTLKSFFMDKSVQRFGHQKVPRRDDILEDFTDGNVFKNNKFFQENPDALRIILYQDAFEIVNPIGAARKKHKLLAIYMTIGNVPHYI